MATAEVQLNARLRWGIYIPLPSGFDTTWPTSHPLKPQWTGFPTVRNIVKHGASNMHNVPRHREAQPNTCAPLLLWKSATGKPSEPPPQRGKSMLANLQTLFAVAML